MCRQAGFLRPYQAGFSIRQRRRRESVLKTVEHESSIYEHRSENYNSKFNATVEITKIPYHSGLLTFWGFTACSKLWESLILYYYLNLNWFFLVFKEIPTWKGLCHESGMHVSLVETKGNKKHVYLLVVGVWHWTQ